MLVLRAPLQAWSPVLIGPFLDLVLVDAWVLDWRTAGVVAFGASCALAVLVIFSQFMYLGRFTAMSYQVALLPRGQLVRRDIPQEGPHVIVSCAV